MIQSRLRNRCDEKDTCDVSLLRSVKKEYFLSLNVNEVINNKSFWKTVKPLLSSKTISSEKITLIDDDELITDEQKVANTLNDFFSGIATSLN